MKCLAAMALLIAGWGQGSFQEASPELSGEEKQALEEYLHVHTVGPVACGPSSMELVHRFGSEVVPYLAKRMLEERKYRPLCAKLLASIAGHWGSLDKGSENALIQVLKDGGEEGVYAAWALGSLCSEAARPDLLKAAESENPYMVRAACLSLGLVGAEGLREKLVAIRAIWQTKDHKQKKEVIRAVADALDMWTAFESPERNENLLKMMKSEKSYDGIGWLYNSERAALRMLMNRNMKELLPDLRMMADDLIKSKGKSNGLILGGPFLFAIHKLGGSVSEEEIKSLRRHTYLLPLKKWVNGYLGDD